MLVCHCLGITDRTIRETVHAGAETADEVRDVCGAGAGCGGCHELVRDVVAAERLTSRGGRRCGSGRAVVASDGFDGDGASDGAADSAAA